MRRQCLLGLGLAYLIALVSYGFLALTYQGEFPTVLRWLDSMSRRSPLGYLAGEVVIPPLLIGAAWAWSKWRFDRRLHFAYPVATVAAAALLAYLSSPASVEGAFEKARMVPLLTIKHSQDAHEPPGAKHRFSPLVLPLIGAFVCFSQRRLSGQDEPVG